MVAPAIVAAGISTAGNILGGLLGGGKTSLKDVHGQLYAQYMAQRRSLIENPSYVVQGAKKAGLHPLSVLGSPVSSPVSGQIFDQGSNDRAANAISAAGQGIASMYNAHASREEKALSAVSAKLGVENQQLQNDRLRSEIALMNQPGRPAGMAANPVIPGQADSGVLLVPKEDTLNKGGHQPGTRASAQYFDYPGLGRIRHMSEEAAEATEDDPLAKMMFSLMYSAPDLANNLMGKVKEMWNWKKQDWKTNKTNFRNKLHFKKGGK